MNLFCASSHKDMPIRSLVIAAVIGLLPAPVFAQRGLLDHAEARVTGGQFTEARGLLQRWRRENPTAARTAQEQQARYHLLAARLTTNADTAEYNYLTVAVDFPTSRVAPEALLRLAQARYTRGDTTKATSYLQRLLSDYPESEFRPMGAVWLSRLTAEGQDAAVCEIFRTVSPGTNPETLVYFKSEQKRVCGATVGAARPTPQRPRVESSAAAPKADSAPPPRVENPSTDNTSVGRVAIQIGAFRELNGARGAQRQLENAGFRDVRLVRVPGNQLIRVRIGKYENRAGAASMLARLANANFSAVLVTDANTETRVTN
jgi:cell division septation protein DedD